MAGIGQWQPAQSAHAIQVAAVGINFKEPLTERLLMGISSVVAPMALELGLSEQSQIPEFGFVLGPNGPQPQPGGMQFLRQERPDFFSDKLLLSKNAIRYEDWSYTRWAVLAEKIDKLIAPIFSDYTTASLVADIFVEYIDVFTAPLESDDSVFLIISEDSPFIARGATSDNGFWHTYSGFFDLDNGAVRRLHQVHVNAANVQSPEGERRGVQIRTFVSDNAYSQVAPENSFLTETWASVGQRLQHLHDSSKADFRKLLTADAAVSISLG